MGGGTNLLIADSGFDGVVIRITNHSLQAEIDACSGATLTIGAGEDWDEFVATTIDRGFAGLETLSENSRNCRCCANSEYWRLWPRSS